MRVNGLQQELLKGKREALLVIAVLHGARNIRVFGSVAGVRQGRILHEYMGVRLDRVWNVIEQHIMELRTKIKTSLVSFGSEDGQMES